MKEFNAEEAKAGKPVCTRDGRPVRIVRFDRNDTVYPIVAIIKETINNIVVYTKEGKYAFGCECDHNADLMMAGEKKEGWVNVYRIYDGETMTGNRIFKTREEALEGKTVHTYITTIKIEWEE